MPQRSPPGQLTMEEQLKKLSPEKRVLLDLMSRRRPISGCEHLVRALLANGVTHIYAISGVPVQEMLAAAVKARIRVIGTHHQQAAVLMAMAHNYVAGKVNAVVIVSAGPAVTNTTTGLLVAKDNAWPVIVFGGRRQGGVEGQDGFQELDAAKLYESIVKRTMYIEKASDIRGLVNKAFQVAIENRPGPVYLDIHEDVFRMQCACDEAESLHRGMPQAGIDPGEISEAAELLLNARRPALIVGKGTRWGLKADDLLELIEQQNIAFISSPMARGIISDEHPLCFNRAKRQLQAAADVILVLGARLNWTFRFGSQINPQAKVIQVDINGEEVKKNRKVYLSIVADAGDFVIGLKGKLSHRPDNEMLTARRFWHHSLTSSREQQIQIIEKHCNSDRLPMSSYRLMKELKGSLPANTILVADGNVSMMAVQNVIPGRMPFSRFTAGTNGCMGVGIPFGIGASLCDPTRPIVVVSGDMAFGVSGMEIETAVRCGIPLIVVVVNNDGLSGGHKQRELYPEGHERVTMFSPGIRYEMVAEAYGARGEYVDRPSQLRPAIKRALKSRMPTCINVKVDPYEEYITEL